MSSKADKFKGLMRSPSGSNDAKEDILKPMTDTRSPANEIVKVVGRKKATFEMDAELHRWLKFHALNANRNMVEILEDIIRAYRSEQEGD